MLITALGLDAMFAMRTVCSYDKVIPEELLSLLTPILSVFHQQSPQKCLIKISQGDHN